MQETLENETETGKISNNRRIAITIGARTVPFVPPFDLSAAFWVIIGGLISVVGIAVVGLGLHRLRLPTAFWILTGWTAGTGLALQALGIYFEMTAPHGDGLMMLVLGAALLSLAAIFATAGAKFQTERKLVGVFPKREQ